MPFPPGTQKYQEIKQILMKMHTGRMALVALTVVACMSMLYATSRMDYRFKVHNKSKSRMVKLLASPDGKKYASFDIGDGIAAGATEELIWDKSTDNGYCEWTLKAAFADGTESEPAVFDFCEKDLVVEFSD
jgi:hypothetical protein